MCSVLQLHRSKENGKSPSVPGGTLWGRSEIGEREKSHSNSQKPA